MIISCNCYFDGIIQPVSFWDFPFYLFFLKAIYYLFHFEIHLTFPLIVFI